MRKIFIPLRPACSDTNVYTNYKQILKLLPIIRNKRIAISNKYRKKRIRKLCLKEQQLDC